METSIYNDTSVFLFLSPCPVQHVPPTHACPTTCPHIRVSQRQSACLSVSMSLCCPDCLVFSRTGNTALPDQHLMLAKWVPQEKAALRRRLLIMRIDASKSIGKSQLHSSYDVLKYQPHTCTLEPQSVVTFRKKKKKERKTQVRVQLSTLFLLRTPLRSLTPLEGLHIWSRKELPSHLFLSNASVPRINPDIFSQWAMRWQRPQHANSPSLANFTLFFELPRAFSGNRQHP